MATLFYNSRDYKHMALFLIALFLVVGCSSDKDDEPGLFDTLSAIKSFSDEAPDLENKMEKVEVLEKMTPLDFSTLKTLLPETLLDMPQYEVTDDTEVLTDLQWSMVTALYGDGSNEELNNDTSSLSLSIQDGAGEMGSATLGLLYTSHTMLRAVGGQTTEDDGHYTKEISLQGHTVLEKTEKTNNGGTKNCLNFVSGDRFIVFLCSENLEMDAVKKAFSQIDTEAMGKISG
ncbi:MAG: hypothetical protein L3J88_01575 [Gammaproteobacteria bacterium]|nr:hypothetical protein [Gammaproteobacteria bacterium]